MPPVRARQDLDHQDEAVHDRISIDDPEVTRENLADHFRARTVDLDLDHDPDRIRGAEVVADPVIAVTIVKGNFDHTTIVGRITSRASKTLTIRITVVVVITFKIEIASTITSITIVLVIDVVAVSIIVEVAAAVVVIVVVDSSTVSKVFAIFVTDEIFEIAVRRHAIDTAIVATRPIQ